MKNLLIIIIGMGLMLSCTTLKKESAKNKFTLAQQESLQQSVLLAQQMQSSQKDSFSSAIEVELWPKGKVKFSAAHGFEGEAIKIKLRKKMQNVQHLQQTTQQQQLQLKHQEVKQQQQQVSKTSLKTKKENYFLPIMCIILSGAIIYIGYVVFKRYKFMQ